MHFQCWMAPATATFAYPPYSCEITLVGDAGTSSLDGSGRAREGSGALTPAPVKTMRLRHAGACGVCGCALETGVTTNTGTQLR